MTVEILSMSLQISQLFMLAQRIWHGSQSLLACGGGGTVLLKEAYIHPRPRRGMWVNRDRIPVCENGNIMSIATFLLSFFIFLFYISAEESEGHSLDPAFNGLL